jgi:hypothetical protein
LPYGCKFNRIIFIADDIVILRLIGFVAGSIELIVEDLADWLEGLHHQAFDAGVGFHLQQQASQHQVLLRQLNATLAFPPHRHLQTLDLLLLDSLPLFQFSDALREALDLLQCGAFAILAIFGALPVPAHALALLAGAAFIAVVGALTEQLGELAGVEVGLGDIIAHLQIGAEDFVLEK